MKNNTQKGGTKNASTKLSDFELHLEETEHKEIPSHINQNSKAKAMARHLVRNVQRSVLARIDITLLDEAIKRRTGKPHSRGAVSRAHAKGYNEGYQQSIKDHEDKWL